MRLAVVSPSKSTLSETFIEMQYSAFPVALRVHGRPVTEETIPGGPVRLRSAWRLASLRGLEAISSVGRVSTKNFIAGLWAATQQGELAARMRRNRIEIVLANFGEAGVAMIPVCRALRIPLVVHFHGADAHHEAVLSTYRDAYRELGAIAARVIVVSDLMRRQLIELGVPERKISLVRYGVRECFFRTPHVGSDHPRFFGVGRFVDKKAQYLTLLAFKEVVAIHRSARLVLAGEGPLLEAVYSIAKALDIGDFIELPGALPHSRVNMLMAEATAFVQHSISPRVGANRGDCEGTPVAILEAMAMGLPIVATSHAGIGEVLRDWDTGLVVAERNVHAMAERMIWIIENNAEARAMGHRARLYAEKHFTQEAYCTELRKVLAAVLAEGGRT